MQVSGSMRFSGFEDHIPCIGGIPMHWFKTTNSAARGALLLTVALSIATPVVAGTVYTWRTEDGTVSFTDDVKHIPARYKGQAETRSMQDLDGYKRFTPADKSSTGSTYAERLNTRLVALKGEAPRAQDSVGHGASGNGISMIMGGTRHGNNGMVVPAGSTRAGDGPTVVEQHRTKPSNSMATRHETVVKQGDRIISIQRNEMSHRDSSGMVPPVD
jgi:hypothetical protein